MVPFETIAVPMVYWVSHLPTLVMEGGVLKYDFGWLNTYQVQILPFVANALAIFLFAQHFGDIPKEIDEAARTIFDPFNTGQAGREGAGAGLGLAISHDDAELHGGRLEAWGRPGDGAQFRLTLPRRRGTELTSSPLPLVPSDRQEP